jgi:serine/threonine-protein kinase RsbW
VSEIFSSVLVLPTDLERLAVLETQISELLAHAPPLAEPGIVQYNVHLAVHELCANIIKHAYQGQTGKFMLTLSLLNTPWRVEVSTYDHGRRHFDVERWTPPDPGELPVYGLGIFLIRGLMDEVSYAPDADCTRWRLVKHLALAPDPPHPAAGAYKPFSNTLGRNATAEAKA